MSKKPKTHPDGNLMKKIINKPVNAQRVSISDAQNTDYKKTIDTTETVVFDSKKFDLDDDLGLEDTPSGESLLLEREKKARIKEEKKKTEKKKEKKKDNIIPETPAVNMEFKTRAARYKKRRGGVFDFLKDIPSLLKFKASTSNSAALEFASSGKRLTKRDKRNRKILIYGGSAVLAAAIILVVIFTSGRTAASANSSASASASISSTDLQSMSTVSSSVATQSISNTPEITPSPTKTQKPVKTTKPEKTPVPLDISKEVKTYQVKSSKSNPYYAKMGFSSNHYKYTEKEKYMLAQVISGEARGEMFSGQIAVGNVVMNRVLNRSKWGNTITSVVTAPGQFTGYRSSVIPTYSARRAAEQVLDFENWVIPQNVYYFRPTSSTNNLSSTIIYCMRIGAHAFYKQSVGGRSSVKSIPPAMFERTYQWPTIGCKPELRIYKLQYVLNKLGYSVKADKYFGQDTADAIKDFQKKHKIKADGVAGPTTIKALINAYNKKFGQSAYYDKFCK